MDYFFEGVGNELLLIIPAYILCVFMLLKFLKLEFHIISYEQLVEVLLSIKRTIFGGEISTSAGSASSIDNRSAEDFRIFNTNCCVCWNENYSCSVLTECGHRLCGVCAMNLIERSSIPMNCPLCRQECRVLRLPSRNEVTSEDESLETSVINSINMYNSRATRRFSFTNLGLMFWEIISVGTFRHFLITIFLKCHVIVAAVSVILYLIMSSNVVSEHVFGLDVLDDIFVIIFLLILIADLILNINIPVDFLLMLERERESD